MRWSGQTFGCNLQDTFNHSEHWTSTNSFSYNRFRWFTNWFSFQRHLWRLETSLKYQPSSVETELKSMLCFSELGHHEASVTTTTTATRTTTAAGGDNACLDGLIASLLSDLEASNYSSHIATVWKVSPLSFKSADLPSYLLTFEEKLYGGLCSR